MMTRQGPTPSRQTTDLAPPLAERLCDAVDRAIARHRALGRLLRRETRHDRRLAWALLASGVYGCGWLGWQIVMRL